jgi:hypothetical protein
VRESEKPLELTNERIWCGFEWKQGEEMEAGPNISYQLCLFPEGLGKGAVLDGQQPSQRKEAQTTVKRTTVQTSERDLDLKPNTTFQAHTLFLSGYKYLKAPSF